jgi:S-layer homology domain
VDASAPALSAGMLNDVVVVNPSSLSGSLASGFLADFNDVPGGSLFHDDVEKVFRAGITAGCGNGNFCVSAAVTRAQMAVFLLKAEHGSSYVPPPCAGIFADVACPSPFADWIEQLSAEGITAGCGGGNYCPVNPVRRDQMAVFLLKTEHGSSYTPPACAGIFGDVACPSTFADWIEQLHAENITGGCQLSPLLYCPSSSNTRGQMATFLTKTFHLQ